MSEPPSTTEFEVLRFLMECSFKEAGLFWRRNSVLLAANLASFAAAFGYLTSADDPISWSARMLVGIFGVFLCAIWALTIASGRFMNHVWVSEAKQVAKSTGHPQIIAAVNQTPSDQVSKEPEFSATKLMYSLAAGFACAWILVSGIGAGGWI